MTALRRRLLLADQVRRKSEIACQVRLPGQEQPEGQTVTKHQVAIHLFTGTRRNAIYQT